MDLRPPRLCSPPAFPKRTGRPRVLVEDPEAWAYAPWLVSRGYDVVTCPGPVGDERCPLLVGGTCRAVEGCDAVVWALPSARGRAIREAVQAERDVPYLEFVH